ncbi:hypothetical protein [Prosthecobacter sp.]|uniref:hypothetical protein n=1 Tax=Prosthecobacter sp. TaxID=1965333 RepID=UPI0037832865
MPSKKSQRVAASSSLCNAFVSIARADDPKIVRRDYKLETHHLCVGAINEHYLFLSQDCRLLPTHLNIVAQFTKGQAHHICTCLLDENFVFVSPDRTAYPEVGFMLRATDWQDIQRSLKIRDNRQKNEHGIFKERVRALLIRAPGGTRLAAFVPVVVDGVHIAKWTNCLYRVGIWHRGVWEKCIESVPDTILEPQQLVPLSSSEPIEVIKGVTSLKLDPKEKRMLLISHFFNNWKRTGMQLEKQGLEISRLLNSNSTLERNNMYNEVCDACCSDPPNSLAQKRFDSLRVKAQQFLAEYPKAADMAEQEWNPSGTEVNVLLSVLFPESFGYEIEHAIGRPMWDCAEPKYSSVG